MIMKKLILICLSMFFATLPNHGQESVILDSIPTKVEGFVAMRNDLATTPEGGAAMFVLAMKIYKENEEFGKKCLVIAADRGELRSGNVYKGYDLNSWMTIKSGTGRYPKIAHSYIKGSSPGNGYAVSLPYTVEFGARNSYSGDNTSGKVRIFILCSGADSPRPITMVKNNRGYWKASKWSSLFAGMKPEIEKVDDDL